MLGAATGLWEMYLTITHHDIIKCQHMQREGKVGLLVFSYANWGKSLSTWRSTIVIVFVRRDPSLMEKHEEHYDLLLHYKIKIS